MTGQGSTLALPLLLPLLLLPLLPGVTHCHVTLAAGGSVTALTRCSAAAAPPPPLPPLLVVTLLGASHTATCVMRRALPAALSPLGCGALRVHAAGAR
jgi:hypothetical protein